MPLPNPKKSEKQGDFVSRCMGAEIMNKDFPDQKQRAAVCYRQWNEAKATAFAYIGSGSDEVLIFNSAKKSFKASETENTKNLKTENKLTASEEKYILVENYKDCPFAIVSLEEDEAELEYCFSTKKDAEEMMSLYTQKEELLKKQDENFLQKKMLEEMVEEKIDETMSSPEAQSPGY